METVADRASFLYGPPTSKSVKCHVLTTVLTPTIRPWQVLNILWKIPNLKTTPNKTRKRPLTITLTTTMADDFGEIAEKIGWSRTTVIERCLAASIKAIKQFAVDDDEGQ